jgi:hypothetical protein
MSSCSSGGENVSSGGIVSGAVSSGTGAGGTVNVLSDGRFSFSTNHGGGITNVSAGGTMTLPSPAGACLMIRGNVTVFGGGTPVVRPGGTGSGMIDSGGPGVVVGAVNGTWSTAVTVRGTAQGLIIGSTVQRWAARVRTRRIGRH